MNKILIVDDDITTARIYQGLLRMEEMEADFASDGEAALQAIHQSRPDLVLLDLMLPKISGLEVLRRIRAEPALRSLPIIVFSNAYLGSMLQEAAAAGATRCIIKAETAPKQLIQLVRATLAGSDLPMPDLAGADAAAERVQTTEPEDIDPGFQEGVQRALLQPASETMRTLRASLQALIKSPPLEQRAQLEQFLRLTHRLTSHAGIAGFRRLGQLCSALEALLKELHDKPAKLTFSAFRTIAQALDSLEGLFVSAAQGETESFHGARILVVDDDAVSRHVISLALTRAGLATIALDDPAVASRALENSPFDVVFLDIHMPGINGFDLCKQLRASSLNSATPVVFITALAGFENRALSILSGGDDVIAKPFSFTELAVKALVYALRSKNKSSPQTSDTSRPLPTAAAALH